MTTATVAFIILICGALFLLIARRILRIAIKAAFAFALIFALLITGVVGWWQGWFSSAPQHPIMQSNQRANTNRRTSR